MCGREPNFELSEEEKKELRKLNWEEFLAMIRHAITHKSICFLLLWFVMLRKFYVYSYFLLFISEHKRVKRPNTSAMLDNSDWERDQGGNSLSTSDEMDQDDTLLS